VARVYSHWHVSTWGSLYVVVAAETHQHSTQACRPTNLSFQTQPEETVEQVCQRNNNFNVAEVIETMHTADKADERMQVSVTETAALVKAGKVRLVDVRTQEEWDAVHIEGSAFLTRELSMNWVPG
jgi:hypothetical protein